jgi:hypothetical protein
VSRQCAMNKSSCHLKGSSSQYDERGNSQGNFKLTHSRTGRFGMSAIFVLHLHFYSSTNFPRSLTEICGTGRSGMLSL